MVNHEPNFKMKTIDHYSLRRALGMVVTGLALGGLFASTASADIYYMKSNYVAGAVAPYNAGGGVPAAALLTLSTNTSTNATLSWYGTRGWYGVQGSADMVNWTNLTSTEAAAYSWSVTVTNPFGAGAFFRLSQTNSFAGSGQCGSCHGDKYTGWIGTAHGTAIKEILNPDGTFVAGRSASCLPCHTVGMGQATGYTYDTNYNNMLVNVGCENCHGPAGWHKNSDHDIITPVVSIDPNICGSCHQGATHPTFQEYTNVNATALSNAPAGVIQVNVGHYVGGHNSFGCAWCHNAYNRDLMVQEYYDKQAGNPHPVAINTAASVPVWTATCATCHDPHTSNYVAQLRAPTFSTNYFVMPTTTDTRTVVVTNYDGSFTTNTVYMNSVVDSLFNPKVQICGQCHGGGRGTRWDGTTFGLVTNSVVAGPVTNIAYIDLWTTNTVTQVFTNSSGVPYLTNTYVSIYISGRTNAITVGYVTNQVVGAGIVTPLIAYTNGTVQYTTNSSGFSTPHYPVQYNVLIGQLDSDYESAAGVSNVLTDPHTLAPNQCADCHVPKYATSAHSNTTGHSFASDNNGCLASCHSSLTPAQLVAKTTNLKLAVTNSFVRVVSLLNQWGTTIAPAILRTNYAQLAWEFPSPGAFGTKSTNNGVKYLVGPPSAYKPTSGAFPAGTNDNLQLSTVPQDIRIARFSLYMLYYDQSLGVHNPTYVKALLADAENRVMNQFVTSNYPAAFSASATTGTNSLTVTFTNYNTGGSVYNWSYSDGGSDATVNPTHTFAAPGVYTVTCTVDGKSMTRTRLISVQ